MEPPLPPSRMGPKGGRRDKHPRRRIVDAIFYVVRTGCAWRQLPHDFSALADRVLVLHALARRGHRRPPPRHSACPGPTGWRERSGTGCRSDRLAVSPHC
ncbi:transposase [Streptomyces sp. NPDC002758]